MLDLSIDDFWCTCIRRYHMYALLVHRATKLLLPYGSRYYQCIADKTCREIGCVWAEVLYAV